MIRRVSLFGEASGIFCEFENVGSHYSFEDELALVNELGNFVSGNDVEVVQVGRFGKTVVVKDKIKRIKQLIKEGSTHPDIDRVVEEIFQKAGVRDKDTTGEIKSIYNWLKRKIRYKKDPVGQERFAHAYRYFVKDPKRRVKSGDCDDFVILGGAMLQAAGHPVRLVLWRKPHGDWQHIFLVAWSSKDKRWLVVDPSEKNKPFG